MTHEKESDPGKDEIFTTINQFLECDMEYPRYLQSLNIKVTLSNLYLIADYKK